MKRNLFLLSLILFALHSSAHAQEDSLVVEQSYTAYELLSSYYGEDFKPFKKKNVFVGLAFSVADKKLQNADYLIQKVIDGDRLDFDVQLKGGYYTGDYGMLGLNIAYYQNKFEGTIFRDPDTLLSRSITRGYAFTPNVRSSFPLAPNERLSFFTEIGITFGVSNTLSRDTKNLDEVQKIFATNYNFRVGLSPGVTFFAMENFAFEVQLDVLGYNLEVIKKTVNGIEESSEVRNNVDFNINLLSLDLGLAYYFGAKKH